MTVVVIQGKLISDELSFHAVFAEVLGFPDFYGRNFNAWIDCMSYLDSPEAEMSSIHVAPGSQLTLHVMDAAHMSKECPKVWLSFLECAAFVNQRRVTRGGPPLLIIAA
jgi:hypothetical protein